MKKLIYLIIAVISGLSSCSSDKQEPIMNTEPEVTTPNDINVDITRCDKQANQAMTDFSLEFLRFAMKDNSPKTVVSPTSLSSCLAMLANGTDGEALDEMLRSIGKSSSLNLSQLNEYWKVVSYRLPQISKDVDVRFANSIWTSDPFGFSDSFKKTTSSCFKSYVFENVDLMTQGGVDIANKWVKENTNGMIPYLFDSPLAVNTVLINTLYFNGEWSLQFCKDNTKVADFYNIDGSTAQCDYLSGVFNRMNYTHLEGASYIEMPYGSDRSFSMIAAIPDNTSDFNSFVSSLNTTTIDVASSGFSKTKVDLKFPRFEFSYGNENLADFLIETGMRKVMGNYALTKMFKGGNGTLDRIIQMNKISVDEKGTTAASATSAEAGSSEMTPDTPVELNFNKPFLFMIRENESGIILYMGVIRNM